mmetsp:Transcript_24833/g.51212  ORF Transcript_24833/g.51212 Transcript_24833/m.51212 type:complete len:495 (-) Transcript_24833:55-1539(-)
MVHRRSRVIIGFTTAITSCLILCIERSSGFLQHGHPLSSGHWGLGPTIRLEITSEKFNIKRFQHHKRQKLSKAAVDSPADILTGEKRVVIVGKIIIDKYGDPSITEESDKDEGITVGGGGPQAAWASAAALAVREYYLLPTNLLDTKDKEHSETGSESTKSNYPFMRRRKQNIDTSDIPPKQPVTFVAPIGTKNWPESSQAALDEILLSVLDNPPLLVRSDEHITPTINIWHDENELVHWMPVDGSFGEEGANGLWKVPTAPSILQSISDFSGDVILHCILESGCKPTGEGLDASMLFDPVLMERTTVVGIEPIVFPDEESGVVSEENGKAVLDLIHIVEAAMNSSCEERNSNKLLIITPDRPCYDAAFLHPSQSIKRSSDMQQKQILTEMVTRNGANGSFTEDAAIPCASLRTADGTPVNPTGAGNAYSAAFVTCRAHGDTVLDAAALATAVGAVVCEYDHLPPWSWEVLERIAEAACEVKQRVRGNIIACKL